VSEITPMAEFFSNFSSVKHALVMQRFGISHESISLFTHKTLGKCAYQENISDK